MIRIACVDSSASARLKLGKFLDELSEKQRGAVGHVSLSLNVPTSLEQLLVSSPPHAVAIGSEFSLEESYLACRRIRAAFPSLPILVFLAPEAYSLRSLRRFQNVADDIFSFDESPVRLLHRIASLQARTVNAANGSLLFIDGVKGGVGTSSLVAAYAHAAEAVGKRPVVMDLSLSASLIQYLLPQRRHSPEYAAAIVDGLVPDRHLLERCITTAPNGINIMLPPAGGAEIRELWLRNPDKFEVTLAVVDILRDMFDIVLVDGGRAEGVLPFALMAHSATTVFVTSNEPGSVHLLTGRLTEVFQVLPDHQTRVIVNTLAEGGLSKGDTQHFLELNDLRSPNLEILGPVPLDHRGRNWIGTGNTFYTESSRSTQRILENQLLSLLPPSPSLPREDTSGIFSALPKLSLPTFGLGRRKRSSERLALPILPALEPQLSRVQLHEQEKPRSTSGTMPPPPKGHQSFGYISPEQGSLSPTEAGEEIEALYSPPQLIDEGDHHEPIRYASST